MKESLILHKNNVQKQYNENEFERSTINSWCSGGRNQPKFSSVCIVDNELLYAACTTESAIVAVTTSLDGVGMRGSIQQLFSYGVNWKVVSSLCIVSGRMFTVSTPGIEMIDLENAAQAIYQDVNTHLPKTLNGPQGNVAGKTIDSVRLVEWGLNRINEVTKQFIYHETNLLRCMTLDVEHFHSTNACQKGCHVHVAVLSFIWRLR